MNTLIKLAAVALSAAGIAGGVAVAQTTNTNDEDGRAQTANYGTPPGAPLKRDGSLSADPKPAATVAAPMANDTSTSTTMAPAADTSSASPAPAADTSSSASDTSMQPRADRN